LKDESKEDSRKGALWSKSIESMWAADIAERRKEDWEEMLDDTKRRGGGTSTRE
jgi:hypothetical protein